jgi:hypothetical protein
MPKIVGDEMVVLSRDDKQMIRKLGYDECADLIAKTSGYVRGLCSKGERKMRKSDIEAIRQIRFE